MKQIILSLILAIACFGFAKADVEVNTTNFPNMGFFMWVKAYVPGADDGVLTDAEIASIKTLNISSAVPSGPPIGSVAGIGFFTELESLSITNNKYSISYVGVGSVDLSENKKIKTFSFNLGPSTEAYGDPLLLGRLTINNLPELESVSVAKPYFSELDLSGCPKLTNVSVTNGQITSVNFEGCVNIKTLNCSGNKIENLDIANMSNLTSLNCSGNNIAALDLSKAKQLQSCNCSSNSISSLIVDGLNALTQLNFNDNQLSVLSISNCKSLSSIYCSKNKLKSLTLDNLSKLKSFDCSNNTLTQLRVANCNLLRSLPCNDNKLNTLDLENLPLLQTIDCSNNPLFNLDFLAKVPSLVDLNCSGNTLTKMDCSQSKLTSITFKGCKKLKAFPTLPAGITSINCTRSPIIAQADLSLYPNLTKLYADSCELTEFDATKCPNLQTLHLQDNHIMECDFTALKKCTELWSWQTINMPAVKTTSQYYPWEITMPATFNHKNVTSISGNILYGTGMRGDSGTQVHVTSNTFTDSNGLTRFSFLTTNIAGEKLKGMGAFAYTYKSPTSSLALGVQVFGYQVSSGIEDISTSKAVSGVRYYDLQGHESAEPFNGFNIEVTHYTDGTSQSKKFIR